MSISKYKWFGALFSIVLVEPTCSTITMSLNVVKSGTLPLHLWSLNNKGVNIGLARVIEAWEFSNELSLLEWHKEEVGGLATQKLKLLLENADYKN